MSRFACPITLRATLAGLALSTSLGLAAAQQAPVAAPPAISPAPAAVTLSPSHLALAIEVVKLSGMSRSIDAIVPEMVIKARQLFTQTRPEIAGKLDEAIKELQPQFVERQNEAVKLAGEAFGSRLSEAELKDIEAFFKSAAGQKFVSSQPGILEEMFRNLDQFNQRLSQFVVDKLREEMKKKGVDL